MDTETKSIEKVLACTATFPFVSVKKMKNGVYKKMDHKKSI